MRTGSLRVVADTFAKRNLGEGSRIGICHERSERVMAIGNYLETACRLREIEPATVFARW